MAAVVNQDKNLIYQSYKKEWDVNEDGVVDGKDFIEMAGLQGSTTVSEAEATKFINAVEEFLMSEGRLDILSSTYASELEDMDPTHKATYIWSHAATLVANTVMKAALRDKYSSDHARLFMSIADRVSNYEPSTAADMDADGDGEVELGEVILAFDEVILALIDPLIAVFDMAGHHGCKCTLL